MKSVGDFAINIIPTIDTKKLREGAAFLGDLGNITQLTDKIFSGFKSAYNMIDDTANSISNLAYTARALKMPIEQVDLLRKSLRLVGVEANDAQGILTGLTKAKFGFKWGKVGEGLLAQGGMTPAMFGGDRLKNIEMLHRVLKGAEYGKAATVLGELGIPESALRLLQSPDFNKIMAQARAGGLITGKQGTAAMNFIGQKGGFENLGETFKANVMENVLPSFTQALNEFTNIIRGTDFVKNMSLLAEAMAGLTVVAAKAFGGTVGLLGGVGDFIGEGYEKAKNLVAPSIALPVSAGSGNETYDGMKKDITEAIKSIPAPQVSVTASHGINIEATVKKVNKENNANKAQVINQRGR